MNLYEENETDLILKTMLITMMMMMMIIKITVTMIRRLMLIQT